MGGGGGVESSVKCTIRHVVMLGSIAQVLQRQQVYQVITRRWEIEWCQFGFSTEAKTRPYALYNFLDHIRSGLGVRPNKASP